MSRHEITDRQWEKIQEYLPKPRNGRGRPEADRRQTLNGIIYILKTGCAWADLPKRYGPYVTCWRKHHYYVKLGIWDRIWRFLLRDLQNKGVLELDCVHLDASFVPAKRGGSKVGNTKIGKGSQVLSIVENKKGLPIALLVENANPHEINFAEKIVEKIRIPQKRGAPFKKPKILVADKGYTSQAFRTFLQKKGILSRIPMKKIKNQNKEESQQISEPLTNSVLK